MKGTTFPLMGGCIQHQTTDLYVGSTQDLNRWIRAVKQPMLGGELATIGTTNRLLAILSIGDWCEKDIKVEMIGQQIHLSEQYPNAFNKLQNQRGYLYSVSRKHFQVNSKLPFPHLQWSAPPSVKIFIHAKVRILNVMEATIGKKVYLHSKGTTSPLATPCK